MPLLEALEQRLLLDGAPWEGSIPAALVDPITHVASGYFAKDPTPTTGEIVENVLKSLSKQVGDLAISVDPGKVTGGLLDGQELQFNLVFEATRTASHPIDRGGLSTEIDDIDLSLDASAAVDLAAQVVLDFTFGFDLTEGIGASDRFFLRVNEWSVKGDAPSSEQEKSLPTSGPAVQSPERLAAVVSQSPSGKSRLNGLRENRNSAADTT